jgi:putative hydrolase of the HAD superfamily
VTVILWDFDGTLAHRPGLWGACVVETLDEHRPGRGRALEEVRPLLRDGFPWHEPSRAHPELCVPDAWWRHVGAVLARAFVQLGFDAQEADELARCTRERYVDARFGWAVFPDTAPALERLHAQGWRHVLVSNHVPELPLLVDALGLGEWFEAVLTSATTGYEKPHPEAFAMARRAAGEADRIWMVGDNYDADVAGAEAVGIPGVLARTSDTRAQRSVSTLDELDAYLS